MSDLSILNELNLPLFVLRETTSAPAPTQIQNSAPTLTSVPQLKPHPLVVCVNETKAEFSDAHHNQLEKILAFLGYSKGEYQLIFKDQTFKEPCDIALSFGEGLECTANRHVKTHSISIMLQNPAVKREVLHAIQDLRRNG